MRALKSRCRRLGVTPRIAIWAAAFSALVLSGSASAVGVFFEFEARVESTNTDFIAAGDTFTGSFGYNTDTPLIGPTSSNFYVALHNPAIYGVQLSLRPGERLFDNYHVGFTQSSGGDLPGADVFSVASFGPGSAPHWPAGPRVNFSLSLIDESGLVFPDLALPSHLDLSDFDTGRIVMGNVPLGSDVPLWRFDSEIISLRVIPEPSTSVLMGLGLLALAGRRRGGSLRACSPARGRASS